MVKLRLAPVNTSAAVISPRGRLAREHGNGCFDPGPVVHRRRLKFDRRHRQRPEVSHPNREEGCGNGIEQELRPVDAWRHLLQQPEPFSDDLKLDEGEARDIAPRTGEVRDEALIHRIGDDGKDDRDRAGVSLQLGDNKGTVGDDQIGS